MLYTKSGNYDSLTKFWDDIMQIVKLGVSWIGGILPHGFLLNTSTLVSDLGGSGKPLIGYIFVSR